ncbi:hypothetical protein LXA43DRAFT_1094704 [Ganoderma leucocontextum]|nr:hypothetical protein LXA43DRAFT_1094704 [Ganoderma leucocontextum]
MANKSLTISADPPYASIKRQLMDSFTLSQCPNIRHLRLLGCYGDELDFLPDTNNLDWAIDFLSNLACSGVTDLTFVLHTTSVVLVRDPWLDQMFLVLAARTSLFVNLERIVFELSTAYTYTPPTADARRTRVLGAAKRIAKRWGNWRRQGLAFEVAENEKAPIAWGARNEDGALVISARTILISADGEKPSRLCDQ